MKSVFKILLPLIILLASCQAEQQKGQENVKFIKNGVLVSAIADQWTFEGTRSMVFLHAVTGNHKDLTFELIEAPDFVKLQSNGQKLTLFIDPPMGSKGIYPIEIAIQKGNRQTYKRFDLGVKKRPKDVFKISKDEPSPDDYYAVAKSGAEVLLIYDSGEYDDMLLDGFENVFIQGANQAEVSFKGLKISHSINITIKGVTIFSAQGRPSKACVEIDSTAEQIMIENCHLQTDQAAKNWAFEQWRSDAKSGIFNYGVNVRITNNLIDYIFHGIENNGVSCLFSHNIVDRFAGDAVRNTASSSIFEYNMLKNAIISDYSAADGNHDDLFQAWTFGAPIRDVRLSHNIAIDYADEDLKLAADTIQGLACFDGFVIDWTIENNLILMDHPHGIALFGAENCKILNNIVARNPFKRHVFESEPWIMVTNHKDGRPSFGNVLKNNLTTALRVNDTTVLLGNNVVMDTLYEQYFEDYSSWNFNKKVTSFGVKDL